MRVSRYLRQSKTAKSHSRLSPWAARLSSATNDCAPTSCSIPLGVLGSAPSDSTFSASGASVCWAWWMGSRRGRLTIASRFKSFPSGRKTWRIAGLVCASYSPGW